MCIVEPINILSEKRNIIMFDTFMGMSLTEDFTVEAANIIAPESNVGAAIAMESLYDNTNIMAAQVNLENMLSKVQYESQTNSFAMESASAVLEATDGGIVKRVKASIQKLWAKVKGFFKSIRRSLHAMSMSTDEFVAKYKTELENLSLSGLKHKVHTFTNLDADLAAIYTTIDSDASRNVFNADDDTDTSSEKGTASLDQLRAKAVGATGSIESSDYSKELYKYFRNNAESDSDKVEINVNIHTVITDVGANRKRPEKITKAEAAMDKHFSKVLKELTKLEKESNKEAGSAKNDNDAKTSTGKATVASRAQSYVSASQAVVNGLVTAWRTAVSAQDSQNKELIKVALRHRPNNPAL